MNWKKDKDEGFIPYNPNEKQPQKELDDFETGTFLQPNKLYLMDCFKAIPKLMDSSLDLVIVDPPYGDNTGYGRKNKEIINNEDETINYMFLDKIYPKMKDHTSLYLFTNWKFEIKLRRYIEKETEFKIRMMVVMVKNNIGMGYGFRNQYELCLVLEKGSPKYNLANFSNVYKVKHIKHNENTHPHQKDEYFIQKIIKHSSNEEDLVFDGFVGSGTIAVACKQLKRKFIGIELDQKWFNIAAKRIKQENIKKWF